MAEAESIYLTKVREALAGTKSELQAGRYNNCANRAYYAVFFAAVYALQRAGVEPRGRWNHRFVASQFNLQLIRQRRRYAEELRGIIQSNRQIRERADYLPALLPETDAREALQRAERFVVSVELLEGATHER